MVKETLEKVEEKPWLNPNITQRERHVIWVNTEGANGFTRYQFKEAFLLTVEKSLNFIQGLKAFKIIRSGEKVDAPKENRYNKKTVLYHPILKEEAENENTEEVALTFHPFLASSLPTNTDHTGFNITRHRLNSYEDNK